MGLIRSTGAVDRARQGGFDIRRNVDDVYRFTARDDGLVDEGVQEAFDEQQRGAAMSIIQCRACHGEDLAVEEPYLGCFSFKVGHWAMPFNPAVQVPISRRRGHFTVMARA